MSDPSIEDDSVLSMLIHRQIFEQMNDMVFVMKFLTPTDFRYEYMNQAAMHASGLNEQAYGAKFQDAVVRHEAEILLAQYAKAATSQSVSPFVLEHNGIVGETRLSPITDKEGRVQFVLGLVRDITSHYKKAKNLEHLAYRDDLTGLYNRHSLWMRVNQSFNEAKQHSMKVGLYILDCDNMKKINDKYGHPVGDQMLKEVARRLQRALKGTQTLARIGGDEFLFTYMAKEEREIHDLAERVLNEFTTPMTHHALTIPLRVSMGISVYPLDAVHFRNLFDVADKALYAVKRMGGNHYLTGRALRQ